MRVRMHSEPGKLILTFDLDDDDRPIPSSKYQMANNVVTTILPPEVDAEKIHPDLLGLCCIMIAEPFVGKEIQLPKPVSKRFFDGHSKVTSRYKISNVDDQVLPWMPANDSVPGLAFSGGVDSTAALSLLPHSTIPVFLNRPLKGRSAYNKDAVENSCREIKRLIYNVQMVECDLEYVRSPVGFPVDVANSVPAILLADHLKLDSIAFGTIMESSYRIGHKSFIDYPRGNHYRHWGGIFAAAGIALNYPVAGISEVGTSIIVNNSPIGFVAQSCMRGTWKLPCLNCWKCFRKLILDSAINSEELDASALETLFDNREALRFVGEIPIKHENVLTWATNRLDFDYELFKLLKLRVEGDDKSYDWMSKWYSKSIELVPGKYRPFVEGKIKQYLQVMDANDEIQMSSWSMSDLIEAESTQTNSDNLSSTMDRHIKSRQ